MIWLIIFVVSLVALTFTLLRTKIKFRYFTYMLLNIAVAAVLLYIVNIIGESYQFHLAVNLVTVLTVGILGMPGLLMLIGIKLAFF